VNPPMSERYLEDYVVGQKFGSGRIRVDKDRIKAFAAEFDPQPFHLDEALASDTIFRGLAAGGIVGTGFDEFRWPRPVRPGDELHLECEILEVRPSKSRTDQGLIKVRTTTLNQNNEPVQIQVGNLLVPRRTAKNTLGDAGVARRIWRLQRLQK
jgi:acyl dehydratase